MDDESERNDQEVGVVIDGLSYRLPAGVLTGSEIRSIPHPSIGPDRDVWLVVPDGSDRFLTDDEKLELREGMHFFTAPQTIMAGGILSSGRDYD